MKYDEYTCARLLVLPWLGAINILPTKFTTSSLSHWPCAKVAMLPRDTFSVVGVDLLATVEAASALASASAAADVIPRLILCTGCSSAVTMLLSALGIET